MKKLLLFAMLFATVTMTSCSKSASSTSTPATLTLVGKWKLVGYISKAGTTTDTYVGKAADYVDFKSNGTVETFIDGETHNTPYTISGSNLILDGETYTIGLAATTASLYYSALENGTRYETTINLKK